MIFETVVSDLWGPQCVRLKVTVKSDNCGENAQCSGKGVCYSNATMVSSNPDTIFNAATATATELVTDFIQSILDDDEVNTEYIH